MHFCGMLAKAELLQFCKFRVRILFGEYAIMVSFLKERRLAMSEEKSNEIMPTAPCDDGFIKSRILTIRGVQVMLDRDLAALYGVPTKVLNQAVKRNIERFPNHFMFQLDKIDIASLRVQMDTPYVDTSLRSQIVTLNNGQGRHLKYMPYLKTPPSLGDPEIHQNDICRLWRHRPGAVDRIRG